MLYALSIGIFTFDHCQFCLANSKDQMSRSSFFFHDIGQSFWKKNCPYMLTICNWLAPLKRISLADFFSISTVLSWSCSFSELQYCCLYNKNSATNAEFKDVKWMIWLFYFILWTIICAFISIISGASLWMK